MTAAGLVPDVADQQETLPGLPAGSGGIWSRYLDANRTVDDAAWRNAVATRQHVGKCRRCGNPLRPGRPYRVGLVAWYPADCTSETCDYETAAHGPRPEPKTNSTRQR